MKDYRKIISNIGASVDKFGGAVYRAMMEQSFRSYRFMLNSSQPAFLSETSMNRSLLQWRTMLHLAFLFATLILAACSTAPVKSNQSQAVSPIQGVHTESQKSAIDSVIQFLLKSAAADFYVHGPKPILHFRDVRIGHDMPSSGEKLYMLCGQFMPARDGDKAEWIPFVTIKTSGYEQYIGNHAATFYQKSSFVWDDVGNLSSLLQSQLDSLR